MQMPSLFKYFAFVGAALLALMSLANFLLEPSTGTTVIGQKQPAKATVAVQHDPRASKIERWRNEQAALKSTVTEPAPATTAATKATWQAEPVAALAEPAKPAVQAAATQASATPEPALQTTDASASIAADEAARAEQAKAEKIKAAKARKARLARERAKAEQQQAGANGGQFYGGYNGGQFYGAPQQRNASNQQDQYYYGQRVPQQRQSYNAYAPRQSYGPFGW